MIKPLTVIGLNSGTSMDGVDAAVFRIAPGNTEVTAKPDRLHIEMLDSLLYEFDPHFKKQLQHLVDSGITKLDTICRLNSALGEVFAESALRLMRQAHLSSLEIDLIGSHGQTIWHAPREARLWGVSTIGSLQLGEPSIIAQKTGIPVIADFRAQDLAAGGQGAPLVPFADQVLFGEAGIASGILNLGGIANITVIDNSGQAIQAFDTGPGNMIIDRAAQKLFNCAFDASGSIAGAGKVDQVWLNELLKHPYFQCAPPKSTGREDFGNAFAEQLIAQGKGRNLSAEDCLCTLTAFTAASICQAYQRFIQPHTQIERIVLGGGGTENKTIRTMLADLWPHPIQIHRHEDFGISTKFKEALLFALLAYTTHFGIANNTPACTGATRRVCLGKLCRP